MTGLERDVAALAARIEGDDGMHELRLDALEHFGDDVFDLIARHRQRLVVCFRPERQGGLYRGDEGTRLAAMRRSGARYVDVEHDVPLSGFPLESLVLSFHDFSGVPRDLERIVASMVERQPAVVKLACAIAEPDELSLLLSARRAISGDAVVIGMGSAGALSRVRYRSFGSLWTYVAGDGGATAPGQLDRASVSLLGLPESAAQPFFALCGGSVEHSPGPHVHNRLFRQRGHGAYAAIACRALAPLLPIMQELGARGISVTMPHKQEALACCRPDALATRVGAVNSLRLEADGWHGRNTDVAGVREPLARLGVRGKALVLGAGGAASAAVEALTQLGLEVTTCARRAASWERRAAVAADVLVNATPAESPWPDAPLPPVVFDLAMAARSLLCEQARAAGSVALDARTMWVHQAAEQMSWFLGEPVTAAELEALLP